jgi:hypothetical protein
MPTIFIQPILKRTFCSLLWARIHMPCLPHADTRERWKCVYSNQFTPYKCNNTQLWRCARRAAVVQCVHMCLPRTCVAGRRTPTPTPSADLALINVLTLSTMTTWLIWRTAHMRLALPYDVVAQLRLTYWRHAHARNCIPTATSCQFVAHS